MSDVCDAILDGNVLLVDNKYLIFYVVEHVENETLADNKQIRSCCFGTAEAVCTVDSGTDSVSVSSCSSKL